MIRERLRQKARRAIIENSRLRGHLCPSWGSAEPACLSAGWPFKGLRALHESSRDA